MLGIKARPLKKRHRTYRNALTPGQSVEMAQFLKALMRDSEVAVKAGVKPDVMNFMKSWSGKMVSEEGKRQHSRDMADALRRKDLECKK